MSNSGIKNLLRHFVNVNEAKAVFISPLQKRVIFENSLAEAMLHEALNNSAIKIIIRDIAKVIHEKIFIAIKNSYIEAKAVELLPLKFRDSIKYLVEEHSSAYRQWKGIFIHFTPEQIAEDSHNIQHLLDRLEGRLLNESYDSISDVAKTLKTICEMAYCVENFLAKSEVRTAESKEPDFYYKCSIVSASPRELNSRIKFKEAQFGLTFGIGRETYDLCSRSQKKGRVCGKSAYSTISTRVFVNDLLMKLKDQGNDKFSKEMEEYKIPPALAARGKADDYVRPTMLERLSGLADPSNPLPIFAGISNTMARSLIMLLELGVFNKGEDFDFDKALIVSNLMFAFLLYAGHHTFLELAETYNRFLDCVGIVALEARKQEIAKQCQEGVVNIAENYAKFFHHSYGYSVLKRAETYIQVQEKFLSKVSAFIYQP